MSYSYFNSRQSYTYYLNSGNSPLYVGSRGYIRPTGYRGGRFGYAAVYSKYNGVSLTVEGGGTLIGGPGNSGNSSGRDHGAGAGVYFSGSGGSVTVNSGGYVKGGYGHGTRGGYGVDLYNGGRITNRGGIYGGGSNYAAGGTGVYLWGSGSQLWNYNRIYGGRGSGGLGAGVYLERGAALHNYGDIYGSTGVSTARYNVYGYIRNSNYIGGRYTGVNLRDGGLRNSGNIWGGNRGVYAGGGNIRNYGRIRSNGTGVYTRYASVHNSNKIYGGGTGVYSQSGYIRNSNSGYIWGGSTGVYTWTGRVQNYGTIRSSTTGVYTSSGQIRNYGTISGNRTGVYTRSGNLRNYQYIYGGVTGVRTGSGYVYNSGTIQGGIGGGVYVGSSATLVNFGTIQGGYGGVGVYLNGATVETAGSIRGSGTADSVQFGANGGLLQVNNGASFSGDIGGFKPGETVDITNLTPAQVQSDFNGATYTITTPSDGTLVFSGPFTGEQFTFTTDGGSGTDVTLVPCFRRGTRIRTEHGETAVESLRIGDCVTTLSGAKRPIRWIGRRSYTAAFASGNRKVLPVLIRAGAVSDAVPHRDLWVSPEHAMFIDGMLIPALSLVNGVSISQPDAAAEVTYFHLEFDTHEVIYAEGAPSESYVDEANRNRFDNAAEYAALYPDAVPTPARFCAPRTEEGEALEAVRQRLAMRAEALARGERRAA
jgi:Hint domain-containing protein